VKFFKLTRFKLLVFIALLPLLTQFLFLEISRPGVPSGYLRVFIAFFVGFVLCYLISSITEVLSKVKFFKLTRFKLLFAALVPLCYLSFMLPEFINNLNITCTLGPCGYHYYWTTDLPYVIDMLNEAMERGILGTIIFFQWPFWFVPCYFIFSIAEALYATLRKSKKTLPK